LQCGQAPAGVIRVNTSNPSSIQRRLQSATRKLEPPFVEDRDAPVSAAHPDHGRKGVADLLKKRIPGRRTAESISSQQVRCWQAKAMMNRLLGRRIHIHLSSIEAENVRIIQIWVAQMGGLPK
jgi:hypothetical protein